MKAMNVLKIIVGLMLIAYGLVTMFLLVYESFFRPQRSPEVRAFRLVTVPLVALLGMLSAIGLIGDECMAWLGNLEDRLR